MASKRGSTRRKTSRAAPRIPRAATRELAHDDAPMFDGLPEPTDRRSWHLISALVGLVTVTGKIDGEQPESLLLVGPSGCGKSAILNRYKVTTTDAANSHIMTLTNFSAWGLEQVLLDEVPRGRTHIIAPELQTLMLRQRGVWDNLTGLLLPALEEGVGDMRVGPNVKAFNGARIGLIGAITVDAYQQNRGALRESGLLSRMLTVRWQRDRDDVLRSQLRHNAGDHSELEKIHIDLRGRVRVGITREALDDVTHYAHEIEPGNPLRAARRFRALAKAIAYTTGEDTATAAHSAALREFARFWKGV